MQMRISAEDVTRTLAEEVGHAAAARLTDTATVRPSTGSSGKGWLFTVPVSGAARGALTVWFERDAAIALCRSALALDTDPTDSAAGALLRDIVTQSAGALETKPVAAGLTTGDPAGTSAIAPSFAMSYDVLMANGLTCRIAVGVELPQGAAAIAPDLRLEAVLEVDLPLVVRFGRAVMPMRAFADLGPGSIIDMARSPDDPVELLVGERVIARGEVVIVGGNYGVRITELTSGRQAVTEPEARVS